MFYFKWSTVLLLVGSIVGCTTVEPMPPRPYSYGLVQSGSFEFITPTMKTFAWRPNTGKIFVNSEQSTASLSHLFSETIANVLVEKGYEFVEVDELGNSGREADFYIGFGLASDEGLTDEQIFQKTQLSTGVASFSVDGQLASHKGSVVIAMFAPNGTMPFWRGLSQRGTGLKIDEDQVEQRVNAMVNMMLNDVPDK